MYLFMYLFIYLYWFIFLLLIYLSGVFCLFVDIYFYIYLIILSFNGRSVKWISEVPYSYGSVRHPPNNSWSPQLLLLKTLLEKELKVSFNSVLINIYCSLEEVISQNTVITIR